LQQFMPPIVHCAAAEAQEDLPKVQQRVLARTVISNLLQQYLPPLVEAIAF
jgi:hypothetical protein